MRKDPLQTPNLRFSFLTPSKAVFFLTELLKRHPFSLQFHPGKRKHGSRSSRKDQRSTVFGLGLSIVALHSLIFFSSYIDYWISLPQTI